MKNTNWCRCPNCGHKLFMYMGSEQSDKLSIKIKCSSCKRIIDVLVFNGRMEVEEVGKETAGRSNRGAKEAGS